MRRREFITLFGGASAWPFLARAQQLSVPVVGFLGSRSEQPDAPFVSAFRQGLVESGDAGKSAKIEFRWADNQTDRLEGLATDLIRLKPAVILAAGGSGTALALKKLTSTVPIVFVMGTDPVKVGLVQRISRPEGNVTGVAFLATQIVAKRLEFLLAFVPGAKRIAVLINPKNPELTSMTRDVESAERSLNIALQTYKASTESEIDEAFSQMAHQRPAALLIGGDTFFNGVRRKLIALSLRYTLPSIFDVREFAAEGGLMSYGTSQTKAYQQAGGYVGRILNGAKPSELPIIQPTRFELVINRTTANALGLKVPDRLLALADEVIQ
jgi:putative tryptophan/tyrosine transport system substrate-binding protein